MDLDPSRLRRGELLAGASAVLLAIFLVGGKWYGAAGASGASRTGWQALTDLRWLLLVTIVAAAGLVLTQVTRRAPAVPVTMSLVVMLLGIVTVVALLYRVLISPPPHQEVGAYLGLLCAVGIMVGGYFSLRQEGISRRDAPADIPIVRPGRDGDPRIPSDA
jgi:cytochrome bd-type quinol oxidase subunit 2